MKAKKNSNKSTGPGLMTLFQRLTSGSSDQKFTNFNWPHPPDTLIDGHVVYTVKLHEAERVGNSNAVAVATGRMTSLASIYEAKAGLKTFYHRQSNKVELTISIHGVTVQDYKSKMLMHQVPLHLISYCTDRKYQPEDKTNSRIFFFFIAKDSENSATSYLTCYLFSSSDSKLVTAIVQTMGQAFDLAYKKHLENSEESDLKNELLTLRGRIKELEEENKRLKNKFEATSSNLDSTNTSKSSAFPNSTLECDSMMVQDLLGELSVSKADVEQKINLQHNNTQCIENDDYKNEIPIPPPRISPPPSTQNKTNNSQNLLERKETDLLFDLKDAPIASAPTLNSSFVTKNMDLFEAQPFNFSSITDEKIINDKCLESIGNETWCQYDFTSSSQSTKPYDNAVLDPFGLGQFS